MMSKAALQTPMLAALEAQAHAIPLVPTIDATAVATARQLLDSGQAADALRARDLLIEAVREPIPAHCEAHLLAFFAVHREVTQVYIGLEFAEDAENGRFAVPVILAVVGTYPFGDDAAAPQLVYIAETAVDDDRFGLSAPLPLNAVTGFESRCESFPEEQRARARRIALDATDLTATLYGEGMGRLLRAQFGVSAPDSHLFVLTRDMLKRRPA